MTELKPCPFCGGEASILTEMKDTTTPVYAVVCNECESITYFAEVLDREGSIEAWNTRPNPWHTGTPTEEGWYLIKYRGIYGRAIGRTEYRAVHRYKLDGLLMIDGGIGADDIWEPFEWQKIEEKQDGRTD